MGRRRVRLQDIAERVGVSVATVSLVLNNKALSGRVRISNQTIQDVKSAATELGYWQGRSVGLIVPWLRESVEIPMVEEITKVLKEAHCNLVLGTMTRRNLEAELEEIRAMNKKGCDALIFEPGFEIMTQPDLLRKCFRNSDRVVLVNQLPCDEFSYVTVDQERCGYIATEHLLALGHRDVACLFWERLPGDPILAGRYKGYEKAMAEYGLSPILIRDQNTLLKDVKKISAVFCCRYWGATDLLRACLDKGIRVPDDLSVVGIADDREKQVAYPTLTTVDVMGHKMGTQSAQMVLSMMNGEGVECQILEPKLIVRESTCVRAVRDFNR